MWNRNGFASRLAIAAGCAGALTAIAAGCGSKNKGATSPSDALSGDATALPKVDPTLCDTTGKNIVTYDLNRDNRADVWRLYKTEDQGGTKIEILTCKQVDFDHDGRKDWVVGYNLKGNATFEKADLDYDGKFDMSSVYDVKTGKVVEVERDTDFDGKYDVKEIYDTQGNLQSVRRDRNNDGQPDLWEQYKNGTLIAILYDEDKDGKVDKREEVPGSRPKVDMPGLVTGTAESDIPAGSGAGSAQPK